MRSSPWFGLVLGLAVALLATRGLLARTPHRASHYLFLGLGLLSLTLSVLELIH